MTIPVRWVTLLTAYLIGLSATAVASDIIDVFGVALPRTAYGVSWAAGLAVVAIVILLPMGRRPGRRVLGAWDAAYLATLVLWTALAASRGELQRGDTLTSLLAWGPLWLTSVAVRMHIRLFGPADVAPAFATVAVGITLLHLVGLVVLKSGIPIGVLRPDELVDRNSISILVAAAAFLLTLQHTWQGREPSWWLVGLIMLGFAHARINGTRSAELVLVVFLAIHVARVTLLGDRSAVWLCAIACAGVVAGTVALGPVLEWLRPEVFGAGDSAVSSTHRGEANRALLALLAIHPWTGVGWEEVLYTRSGRYISHTLYLLMTAAYGLVSFIPALAALVWTRFVRGAAKITPEQALAAVVITTTASFVNDPLAWYGLALPLCSSLVATIEHSADERSRVAAASQYVALRDVRIHLRATYMAGAAVGLGCLAILAAILLLRDRYVATADLQIASRGTIAVESSNEADDFVRDAVLRETPALRDRCSIQSLSERQALIVACKGKTEVAAVQALDKIIMPIMRRHTALVEAQRRVAELTAEIDRAQLARLTDQAASLQINPPAGDHADTVLLSLLNNERAKLQKTLETYERRRGGAIPTRTANGTQVVHRRQPWLLALVLSVITGFGTALALALGRAAHRAATP